MEPISLVFYAVVCGTLSLIAPNFGGALPRMAIGAVVGVIAAICLPFIQGMMGSY